MKKASLLVLATAGILSTVNAPAQVNLYITGATAFRSQTYSILRGLFDPGFAQNPASGSSSNFVTWSGTINSLFPGQSVTVYANYNGAVAGVQNLTLGTSATFLASTNAGDYTLTTNNADIVFSSVYQASTPYTTPLLNDTIFGATPVYWLKSVGAPAGLTNITAQQVKELAANGYLPGSYFTGNTNDYNTPVYFITRDTSAGQRVIVFRDSGFTGSPLSYINNGTSWVVDPTGQTATPTIVSQLNTHGAAVSYLTGTDAINVTNGTILSYNGVSSVRRQHVVISCRQQQLRAGHQRPIQPVGLRTFVEPAGRHRQCGHVPERAEGATAQHADHVSILVTHRLPECFPQLGWRPGFSAVTTSRFQVQRNSAGAGAHNACAGSRFSRNDETIKLDQTTAWISPMAKM